MRSTLRPIAINAGHSAAGHCVDLVTQRLPSVLEKFSAIDILINNAGLETEGTYLSLPGEKIQETIEVNLIAPMELTYLVLPHMLEKKMGHIVNMASTAAKCGGPYAATYDATKAGLAEWTQGLCLELAKTGMHFSTIFPGYITGVGRFARFGLTSPRSMGPCTPAQVANAVATAIEQNTLEIIVNPPPASFLCVARVITFSCGLADVQARRSGVPTQASRSVVQPGVQYSRRTSNCKTCFSSRADEILDNPILVIDLREPGRLSRFSSFVG